MRTRVEPQALLGETLAALHETTLTEPLPKRWVALIHTLNARELDERDARYQKLPLNTWLVIAQPAHESTPSLVSTHRSQAEAELARDRRNRGVVGPRYHACIVLEPIAQRMGGQQSPTARLPAPIPGSHH